MTTNAVAEVSPKDKLKNGQKALRKLLKPVRAQLYCAQFIAFCSALLSVAPYIALVALEDAFAQGNVGLIKETVKWLVVAFLSQLSLYFVALLISHLADAKLVSLNRQRIIRAIGRAPLAWCGQTNSGKVRKAIEDDTITLHSLTAHAPVDTVTAIATPLALLLYVFSIDWRLGILAVATVPVYLAIQAYSMKGMGDKTAEMDTYLGDVSATAVEFAEGIAVVKAFGTVGKAHRRYQEAADRFSAFYYAWVRPLLKVSAVSDSVIAIPLLLLINVGVGSILLAAGEVTVAEVLISSLVAFVIPGTIQTMGMMMWSYQLAGNAALRLDAVMSLQAVSEGNRSVEKRNPTVEFEHVSFAYSGVPVIKNFSATLAPGTITALVGPSGAGKSTVATMLARFQDPDAGRIMIDGINLRELSFSSLYSTVSFVLQDPHILRMSIRDNIALYRTDATDEEIWEAARVAHIAADIRALPQGMDTIVGEDTSLSGGQQQRISIARAVLSQAPILILDEATAATDPDCEAEIQSALSTLVIGKTVLVIAHKPESIRGVDQIIHLTPVTEIPQEATNV